MSAPRRRRADDRRGTPRSRTAPPLLPARARGRTGKKRKKKQYTKPKKIKKTHKTVKLATLKFYKVDGDKVTRLRKSCPDPSWCVRRARPTRPRRRRDRERLVRRARADALHRVLPPFPISGPGWFMANHFDRHYCGKCHRSVVSPHPAPGRMDRPCHAARVDGTPTR